MQPNSVLIILALALGLGLVGLESRARAEDSERRLPQYRCSLRLPTADFAWVGQDDLPGATLACRDTSDRFIILIVAEAPRGYRIDAGQGAAFLKGMDRQPDIERLGSKLTEFLGVTCFEIRGRLKPNQSLTMTRFFAANGFLYNLQVMIPATENGEASKFNDLFASFQFIGSTPTAGTSGTPETAAATAATPAQPPAGFAPGAPADSNPEAQTLSELPASPNLSRATSPQAPLKDGLPEGTGRSPRARFWVTTVAAGGLLGVLCSAILLWCFRHGR